MLGDYLLVAGASFVLILAVGQLLIKRKHSTNRVLGYLFIIPFMWIAHGVGYRFGIVDRLPHLNKIYLPLLCITGSLWYTYVKCLYNASPQGYSRKHFLLPVLTVILSIPFYLESGDYKRAYVEVELVDFAAVTMYAASRVAELTLIFYFCMTLLFLARVQETTRKSERVGVGRMLKILTVVAIFASIVRLFGSIAGSDSVSVLYPCLISIGVFIVMHFLSYRKPVVLSLSNATRSLSATPDSASDMERIKQIVKQEKLFLDPNLKIQRLARKTEMPTAKLSSAINTATGKNFNELINDFRVDHAKSLLLDRPEMSILDVTHESGFNSKSSFYRHFSAATGETPAQYRSANTTDGDRQQPTAS
jgi:AraC-like DNA-binding protein